MVKNKNGKKNSQIKHKNPTSAKKKPEQTIVSMKFEKKILIFFSKQPEIILNWEKENAKGKLPLERGFHTSTIVSGTKIFYTGGDAKNTYFKGKQN
jgi:hypothetical protein